MNKTMTRKEMITACINDQITRGIIKPEKKDMQIKTRLKGLPSAGIKAMSYAECLSWYEDVFKTA